MFFWHQPRGISRGKQRTYGLGLLLAGILPLVLILLSCQSSHRNIPNTWNTYHNPRYGFEFPYPSNWLAFPMPDNRDGRAFRDPNDPNFEIRGWAGSTLSPIHISSSKNSAKESPTLEPQNFTTEQGWTGQLQVEVGSKISSMTLTLNQDKLQYNWQGQCASQEFADRYRFFYYIARQYRLPPDQEK